MVPQLLRGMDATDFFDVMGEYDQGRGPKKRMPAAGHPARCFSEVRPRIRRKYEPRPPRMQPFDLDEIDEAEDEAPLPELLALAGKTGVYESGARANDLSMGSSEEQFGRMVERMSEPMGHRT